MSQRRLRERGAAAVEMALVLPVLVLFIGGIIDFGRAFMTEVILTNAAREGARVAQYTTDSADLGNITARAQAAADLNPLTAAQVEVHNDISPTDTSACTTTATQVTVTVTTNFDWIFLKALPLPASLTGKSVMGC